MLIERESQKKVSRKLPKQDGHCRKELAFIVCRATATNIAKSVITKNYRNSGLHEFQQHLATTRITIAKSTTIQESPQNFRKFKSWRQVYQKY